MRKFQERTTNNEATEELKALIYAFNNGTPDEKEDAITKLFYKVEDFIWYFLKREYPTFYSDAEIREELYAECLKAFMECIGDFNPEKGTLSNWVTYPFRHAVTNWIGDNIANSSGYHAKQMREVEKVTEKLQERGIPVTAAQIAFETGMSIKTVEKVQRRIEANRIKRFDSNEELEGMISARMPSPEDAFMEEEAKRTIFKALSVLPDQDKLILVYHFGLDGGDPRSYAMVGKMVGISAPQVQTSIARSLRILKGNTELRVMFGMGAKSYRQKQLDTMEISLVTNDRIASAYDCLDEDEDIVDISIKKDSENNVKVMLTF